MAARLTRPAYDVALTLDGEVVEHRVEVAPGDQLRGELEAKKNGLGPISEAPLNHTVVWIWCALVRLGLYEQPFQQFRATDLYAFEPAAQEPTPVDPTTPAP